MVIAEKTAARLRHVASLAGRVASVASPRQVRGSAMRAFERFDERMLRDIGLTRDDLSRMRRQW